MMGAKKTNGLTEKQRRFVNAYMGQAAGNATEAARIAGYKGTQRSLESIGSENLRKVEVRRAIEALRATDDEADVLTRRGRQIWLRRFVQREDIAEGHRLKAMDMLAKMDGDYLERRQIEGVVQVDDLRTISQKRLERPGFWQAFEESGDNLVQPEVELDA